MRIAVGAWSWFCGTVTLSCSGTPLGAACSASQSTIPVSSAGAVPFQVTVTTSGNAILVPPGFADPGMRLWFTLTAVLLTLMVLMQLMILNGKGSRLFAPGLIRFAGFTAIAGLLLFQLSGGGGKRSAGGSTDRNSAGNEYHHGYGEFRKSDAADDTFIRIGRRFRESLRSTREWLREASLLRPVS
jgi:hypothetical protein